MNIFLTILAVAALAPLVACSAGLTVFLLLMLVEGVRQTRAQRHATPTPPDNGVRG